MSSHPIPQEPNQADPAGGGKPWYRRPGCLFGIVFIAVFGIIILVTIVSVLGLRGWHESADTVVEGVREELGDGHVVTYEIGGDARDVLATYYAGEEGIVQEPGVAAGWSTEVALDGPPGAELLAANAPDEEGAVTCRIIVNGVTVAEDSSGGRGGAAGCSADLGAIQDAERK